MSNQTTGQLFIRENSLKCQPFPRCKGVETADISDYVEMFSYGFDTIEAVFICITGNAPSEVIERWEN